MRLTLTVTWVWGQRKELRLNLPVSRVCDCICSHLFDGLSAATIRAPDSAVAEQVGFEGRRNSNKKQLSIRFFFKQKLDLFDVLIDIV